MSVIIPVYNDPVGITDTLNSLLGQTYPVSDYEVLVVDDGPRKATRSVVNKLASGTDVDVCSLKEPPDGTAAAARNRGIEYSHGDLLFFLDSDVTVAPSWISKSVAAMDRTGARYAGCNVVLSSRERARQTIPGRYTLASTFSISEHIRQSHYADTAALLTTRNLFEQIGNFDSRLASSEDREFGQRVYAAGISQHYFDDIIVKHPTRATAIEVLKRKYRIGYGKSQGQRWHGYMLDTKLSDPVLYLPNVWPWNAYKWAAERFGEDGEQLSTQMIVGLFVFSYLAELSHTSGRISERLVNSQLAKREQ